MDKLRANIVEQREKLIVNFEWPLCNKIANLVEYSRKKVRNSSSDRIKNFILIVNPEKNHKFNQQFFLSQNKNFKLAYT